LLDSLYGQAMRVRRRHFERDPRRQRRLLKPVISVGNLSMGGTGKSPVVAAIAQWLIDAGERPAILSRGYGRRDPIDGVVVVSDGVRIQSAVDRSGDEPMMLARQVTRSIVCVSPDRHLAGVLAEQRLGGTVHILDDGFQHLELARDLDILVTSVGEISNGKVIPAGRLREPMDAAARAQVLVVSDATAGAAASEAWALGISQSCGMLRSLGEPIAVGDDKPKGLSLQGSSLQGLSLDAPVFAVAGIAHPERFVTSLKDAGWNVVGSMSFRDHHRYSSSDIGAIAARVAASGATAVFTTDKDAVRFEALGELPFALYRVPLTVAFDPAEALFGSIKAVLT
jgi:tetraacyldisaccharide 4'-kinase